MSSQARRRPKLAINEKLKVVHLSSVDLGILFLRPQLRSLLVDGFEVHAMCGDGPWIPSFKAEGIKVHLIEVTREISPLSDLKLLCKLVGILRREKYTILHAHTPKLELIAQFAARLARVPFVLYTNHGFIFRGQMSVLRRLLLKNVARCGGLLSDHTLSQSAEDIRTATEQRIYRRKRLSYLGNGIDLSSLSANRFTATQVHAKKREIGIPNENKVVGMVGRYVWEKGYREFFEAARQIAEHRSDVSFLTVGIPLASERDPVDFNVLKELGIEDRVVVLKSRDDMPDLLAVMDVVVLPSYREGFPRSLMEAAAMSKPTIATNISGCREAVIDGYNGFLVPVRDKAALADKISLLLDDWQEATRLGANGRILAEERFDERKVIERLKACYAELLSRNVSAETIGKQQAGGTSTAV